MMSWHGNTFRIIGLIWGKSTVNRWLKNDQFVCFFWCSPEKGVEQTVQLPVIWDTMMLMWRHGNHGTYMERHCGVKANSPILSNGGLPTSLAPEHLQPTWWPRISHVLAHNGIHWHFSLLDPPRPAGLYLFEALKILSQIILPT